MFFKSEFDDYWWVTGPTKKKLVNKRNRVDKNQGTDREGAYGNVFTKVVLTTRPRIPPMLNSLIESTIIGVDGAVYSDLPVCSVCSGDLSGYDNKTRLFARIRENGERKDVHVIVTRYRCKGCGRIVASPAPFYPDTRLGIPVVDLCRALAAVMPSTRAARTIAGMGILVDPASVRSYARQFQDPLPTVSLFGYPIPLSLLSLVRSHGFGRDRDSVIRTKGGIVRDSPAADRAGSSSPSE